MTETLEYIEAYFTNALGDAEKKAFEEKCETDNAFAQEVAVYTLARQALSEKLLEQKKAQWKQLKAADNLKTGAAPVRRINFRQWAPYAAAACILLAVVFTFLNSQSSPQQLADKYIAENYIHLSGTMAGGKETIEQGIAYYNDKKYDSALVLFKSIDTGSPVKISAKKYEGMVYLVTKDYDKALDEFQKIAEMDLESNPGMFLKAITLLRRNKDGDKEEAKKLLNQIIEKKQFGSKDAQKLLDEIN